MISVVIVTWNNREDIKICLESLKSQTFKEFNVILVDNNSADDTVATAVETFPEIHVIKQKQNYMLTKSNNDGIKYAVKNFGPKYILVLNPDTKCEKNLIKDLKNFLDKNKKSGAVGPKIKFFNNANAGLINSAGIIYDDFKQAYDRGFMEVDKGQYDVAEKVPAVTGACVMYRVSALVQCGLYWERLKMYLDEVELAIRLRKHGWEIWYTPSALVWHSYMTSTSKNKKFDKDKQKNYAWLLIAMRHYPILRKAAMLKQYLVFIIFK